LGTLVDAVCKLLKLCFKKTTQNKLVPEHAENPHYNN
jgi:hypothetical protein